LGVDYRTRGQENQYPILCLFVLLIVFLA
jgi:hypothetical protein